MTKLFLFDLDGTLRETQSGKTFIETPLDQKPMTGALHAIEYCSIFGTCIGITNQGGCAALDPATGQPRKSIENMIAEQQQTLILFPKLEMILACSDYSGDICWQIDRLGSRTVGKTSRNITPFDSFRKPGTGMIQKAIEMVDADDVWMFGDRDEDRLAAMSAQINFLWADIVRNEFVSQPIDTSRIDVELLNRFGSI